MFYIIIQQYNNKPYLYFSGTQKECSSKLDELDKRSASKGWSCMKGVGTFFTSTYFQCKRQQVRTHNSICAYMTDDVQDIKTYFKLSV